jgi:hypothetical protein
MCHLVYSSSGCSKKRKEASEGWAAAAVIDSIKPPGPLMWGLPVGCGLCGLLMGFPPQ